MCLCFALRTQLFSWSPLLHGVSPISQIIMPSPLPCVTSKVNFLDNRTLIKKLYIDPLDQLTYSKLNWDQADYFVNARKKFGHGCVGVVAVDVGMFFSAFFTPHSQCE